MLKILFRDIPLLFVVTTALHWTAVWSEPTLDLVSSPDSLRFSESDAMRSSSMADFLSLALGYTLAKPLEWKGLTAITDVFSLAKASVTLRINGELTINSIYKIPILETQSLDNEFEILSERTQQKFSDNNRIVLKINSYQKDTNVNDLSGNQLLSLELSEPLDQRLKTALHSNDLANFVQNNGLDSNDPNIRGLILEISTIRQTIESLRQLKASDNKFGSIRAVIWFDVRYFGHIIEDNNYDQSVKKEAKTLITKLVEELKHDLRDIYENRVIFCVIEGESSLTPVLVRKVRELAAQESGNSNNSGLNLAHDFDPNFHTAFAMIAFTTILIAVSVFGISVSMWNLDPGKDSIIYRMTSQRMKKDQ